MPKDPWGNAYVYLNPGSHGEFDVISLGADGQPGGEGKDADIGSWML
ncbi:MAG: type II secretion system protein GspG [Thiobacillaceae bacterium]